MQIPRINAKYALLIFLGVAMLSLFVYVTSSSPSTAIDYPDGASYNPFDRMRRTKVGNSGIPVPRGRASKLNCGSINEKRYEYLSKERKLPNETPIQFYFALDIDDAPDVMHTLFSTMSKAMIYLGPERCAFSIVGSPNKKITWNYLEAIVKYLEKLGVKTFLEGSVIDSRGAKISRIEKLAKLRNMAFEPFYALHKEKKVDTTTTIIFTNDIGICPNDVLELIHQHRFQGADMLCAMDWNENSVFYDTWISRTITGELFIDVQPNYEWGSLGVVFTRDNGTMARYKRRETFQVFSCWNGIVSLSPKPFLEDNIRFRARINEKECEGGEPFYLAKDFWWNGYTKIGVVPTINVAYTDEYTKATKEKHGSTDTVTKDFKVEWGITPPKIVCCPGPQWENIYRPWKEELKGKSIYA